MTETPTIKGARLVPEDLSDKAVKLARRLQALPDKRTYSLVLTKDGAAWALSILNNNGTKVEVIE
jgi:hypothetical protein